MYLTSQESKRVFILGLDGTPHSLLKRLISDGLMPNLAELVNDTNFRSMDSVMPAISSVAWSSFMTGNNPSKHGIYGFIERIPKTMDVYVPTATHQHGQTLWEYLSLLNKRVFVMNVPVTYPPRTVNGIIICGFLGTDILQGTYPPQIGQHLKQNDYRIDVDTWRAREDLESFYSELLYVYEKRIETMWYFYQQEEWDLFMCHIMETDRLNHFVWEYMEKGDSLWTARFIDFYVRIDQLLARILEEIKKNTELVFLSDHGFCTLKKEVFVNKWLYDKNYLRFIGDTLPESLHQIHPTSTAYSLIPGRIYINLKGREKNGSINPGIDYEKCREALKSVLLSMADEQSGEKIVKEVLTREELYMKQIAESLNFQAASLINEQDPFYLAPDLVVVNRDGYDFKGNLWRENLTEKGPIVGTHTFDDAFLFIRDQAIIEKRFSIVDCMPSILDLMRIESPANLDGQSVIKG
jgi:predicted AlkP superfamily phosphohydrolase/phosphomutase